MSGAMYKYVDFGTGTPILVRGAHLYDPSLYWYGASSGERNGIGLIAVGKGSGRDLVLPSLDWEKDICVYGSGGDHFRNSECPKVSFTANGVPSVNSEMCLYNFNDEDYRPSGSGLTLGKYCATTAKFTRKIKARDYDTYDSQLHRKAGVSGIVNAFNAFHGDNVDTPHGSVFVYDNVNAIEPTFLSLVALRNMFIGKIFGRHDSADEPNWRAWVWTPALTNDGYTFYVGPSAGKYVRQTVVRNLNKTVTIDGNTHYLYMVAVDFPRSSSGNLWSYAEGPWYEVVPDSGVASSMYVLEEWVTCHKPGVL